MKFGKIFHLGVVVRDLDAALRIYEEELGYGPFEHDNGAFFDDKMVNGKIGPGLPMKSAIYHAGDYEIELIEPTGPSIYMDYLKSDIDDTAAIQELRNKLQGRNIVVIAPGRSAAAVPQRRDPIR